MRSDIGLIIAIIAILLAMPIIGVMAGDSGEDEDNMTTIDVAHSEYVKSAKLDYLGYDVSNGNKYMITTDVYVNHPLSVTFTMDDLNNCGVKSQILKINSVEDYYYGIKSSLSNNSVTITSSYDFTDVGTSVIENNAVTTLGITSLNGTKCRIGLTVNVIEEECTMFLKVGDEWVKGTPYVNTGSEWVKVKKIYVHDGTGWKLSK